MSSRAAAMVTDNVSVIRWTSTIGENGTEDESGQGSNLAGQVIFGMMMSMFILLAFGGNLLISYTILTDRVLKERETNWLLVSLAFSDMMVALMVMPFALINDVHGRWEFGTVFCLLWVCFDISCSTASILNLCAICIDRFMQITRPLFYRGFMTSRKILMIIAAVWLTSAFLAFVPLQLGWHMPSPEQRIPFDPYVCILDISFLYAVVSSCISFYIPGTIILVLYLKIFLATRDHLVTVRSMPSIAYKTSSMKDTFSPSSIKATKTLSIITGVFIVCWLPFFIINPIAARCAMCIPPLMFQVFTWLGWVNSCANPFIYSLLNREFRQAFQRRLYPAAQLARISESVVITRLSGLASAERAV